MKTVILYEKAGSVEPDYKYLHGIELKNKLGQSLILVGKPTYTRKEVELEENERFIGIRATGYPNHHARSGLLCDVKLKILTINP